MILISLLLVVNWVARQLNHVLKNALISPQSSLHKKPTYTVGAKIPGYISKRSVMFTSDPANVAFRFYYIMIRAVTQHDPPYFLSTFLSRQKQGK
jgi:hypothetical protein